MVPAGICHGTHGTIQYHLRPKSGKKCYAAVVIRKDKNLAQSVSFLLSNRRLMLVLFLKNNHLRAHVPPTI